MIAVAWLSMWLVAVPVGEVEIGDERRQLDPGQHVQGCLSRVDIMNGMEDRAAPQFRVGGDDPPRHPVMTVNDQPAAVLGPDVGDDMVHHLLLKFGGILMGKAFIGAGEMGKNGRVD